MTNQWKTYDDHSNNNVQNILLISYSIIIFKKSFIQVSFNVFFFFYIENYYLIVKRVQLKKKIQTTQTPNQPRNNIKKKYRNSKL